MHRIFDDVQYVWLKLYRSMQVLNKCAYFCQFRKEIKSDEQPPGMNMILRLWYWSIFIKFNSKQRLHFKVYGMQTTKRFFLFSTMINPWPANFVLTELMFSKSKTNTVRSVQPGEVRKQNGLITWSEIELSVYYYPLFYDLSSYRLPEIPQVM